ncbi:MAG: hypothetical protein MZV70_68890 [Desulfobacterales bacterium]|nr:hypothetical protein [Desulfobacterales bacterium]
MFTELSFSALRCLKAGQGAGHYVVADATRLPFKKGVFRTRRLFRGPRAHRRRPRGRSARWRPSWKTGGRLVVTFPHRRDFFAVDDRFVGHHRRYDLAGDDQACWRNRACGACAVCNVLGPARKTHHVATTAFLDESSSFIPASSSSAARQGISPPGRAREKPLSLINRLYAGLARIDARVVPDTPCHGPAGCG